MEYISPNNYNTAASRNHVRTTLHRPSITYASKIAATIFVYNMSLKIRTILYDYTYYQCGIHEIFLRNTSRRHSCSARNEWRDGGPYYNRTVVVFIVLYMYIPWSSARIPRGQMRCDAKTVMRTAARVRCRRGRYAGKTICGIRCGLDGSGGGHAEGVWGY